MLAIVPRITAEEQSNKEKRGKELERTTHHPGSYYRREGGDAVNRTARRTPSKSAWDDKAIMTCDEVATFLRVHVSSVRRWSRGGKLRAFKVGGRGDWRYRHQDVLAFLYKETPDGQGEREVARM